MRQSVAYCAVVVAIGVVVVLAIAAPHVLGDDKNRFLRDFVNHEFLNVLGVILAITLASTGQIHLALNRLEERAGRVFLNETRATVQRTTFWLIGIFLLAVVLVVVKPLVATEAWSQTLVNGAALVTLLCTALTLTMLTQFVFRIKPYFGDQP